MSQDIVMVHGANCGGWCFEQFRAAFEDRGWSCHTPDPIGHGGDRRSAEARLIGVGIADYRRQMEQMLGEFAKPPVLLGHSMGAVIVEQLASQGLARAVVLVSPAPRAGILPKTDRERQLAQDLMSLGDFWNKALDPIFEIACAYSLNRIPPEEQRRVFDRFGPESGKALFELFFWLFDLSRATLVDIDAVRCPVLVLSGTDDRLISIATARATAASYVKAEFWELADHGHMVPVEPGAEIVAVRIMEWLERQP